MADPKKPKKPRPPRLPEGAWPAIIEAGVGCTHLLVWADWLDENNDPLGADALRWACEKKRWPTAGCWTHAPVRDVEHRLPQVLQKYYNKANGELKWAPKRKETAFRRLMATWRILPKNVRAKVWKWEVTDPG
jgi:uncharacterized protein (TIGR02996 family)